MLALGIMQRLSSSSLPLMCQHMRAQKRLLFQCSNILDKDSFNSSLHTTNLQSSMSVTSLSFGQHGVKLFGSPRLPVGGGVHTSALAQQQSGGNSTALAIIQNVKQLPSSPKVALLLGTAGLVPFIAAPCYMMNAGVFMPCVALYQCYYGATALSFLGGVRWGLTLPPGSSQSPDMSNLGYSILPQLWACASLVAGCYLDCIVVTNVGVTLGLGLTGYKDLAMYGYPGWYKGLRFTLTLGAVLAMWTCLMCKLMMDEKVVDKKQE